MATIGNVLLTCRRGVSNKGPSKILLNLTQQQRHRLQHPNNGSHNHHFRSRMSSTDAAGANTTPPPPSSTPTSSKNLTTFLAVAGGATLYTTAIYSLGYNHGQTSTSHTHTLPSSLPRTCCSAPMADHTPLLSDLATVVQSPQKYILEKKYDMESYCRGARMGHGAATAVVKPGTLTETRNVVRTVLRHDGVIVPQGANTGLTGGSVPRDHAARGQVVINTRRLNTIFKVDNGDKVLCLAGVGIADLSQKVGAEGRESHSILGSTFLNPTVAAGVSYGSGGTQVRKGPAYTDRALFLRVGQDGKTVEVVNTLGIEGLEGDDALRVLDNWVTEAVGDQMATRVLTSVPHAGKASDVNYRYKVCDTKSKTVARFNADTSGIDVNRSEGKVFTLATVHDTFPKPHKTKTYWISFRDFDDALAFRKNVILAHPDDLPVSCEYMDRDSFDIVDRSGRIMATMISKLGPTHPLIGTLWDIKLYVEALPLPYAEIILDKALHWFNYICFPPLNSSLMRLGREMDHHLMVTVGEYGPVTDDNDTPPQQKGERSSSTLTNFETRLAAFIKDNGGTDSTHIKIHNCTPEDAIAMSAFRFVAATSFRTWCVGTNSQGISVDYALPRCDGRAPSLSSSTGAIAPLKRMRYSHFGCNVVHEDVAYEAGVDVHREKMNLKKVVEGQCGGRLPAEHGHGMEYKGSEEAKKRWMRMDPSNSLNPGVAGLSANRNYED